MAMQLLSIEIDYDKRGGKIHGPYVPDATITPGSLAGDFLIFCVLAKQVGAIPNEWQWN